MSRPGTESPESLLESFLQSRRSEESFTLLVKATGGLVYGSALRRTGDPGLAEEVAQNVFTILARKAESLRSHPSLSSWLYRTASFEAAKALRNEARHRRRIAEFTAETMSESAETGLPGETLQLLEQSIDQLSQRDRSLLLARFFEGKKFREIAVETRQSEAACKVRLRRVMDKMAGWLSSHGCTLSVTALTALLTAEWARACPPNLLSGLAKLSQTAPISSSLFFPPALATMKISKMTIAGIVLLIGAAATPFVINRENKKTLNASMDPKVKVSQSDGPDSRRTAARDRSVEELLSNYPFAYERLEELYQKYPNLRLPEFVPLDGPSLVDELSRYFESMEPEEFRVPVELRNQSRGMAEWDAEAVARYLEGKKEVIDRLLEISKFPAQASRFRYLISETTPELSYSQNAHLVLELAFLHETRAGSPQRAEEYFQAMSKIHEGTSQPFLVNALVGSALRKGLLTALRNLAQEGYEVGSYTDQVDRFVTRQSILNGLRLEAGGAISLLEAAKQVEDRSALMHYIGPMMMPVKKENGLELTVDDQLEMRKEGMTWDINEFQDAYAKVISGYLDTMPDPARPETMLRGEGEDPEIKILSSGLSKGQTWILESFVPKVGQFAAKIPQTEILMRELSTWNALNQATAAGFQARRLSDLVPEFLSGIPVNPVTNEPFVFDAETRTLGVGE